MSTQEVFVQQFSRLFHHYRESLSAEHEADTWNSIPAEERARLVAAARLAIQELDTSSYLDESRRYFAKPGQAEWGC
jgi:hypothetical protein